METPESLSTNPKDYVHFVFYSGYVESNACAPLIVSHDFRGKTFEKFADWRDAWEHMFTHFRNLFIECVKLSNGLPSKIEGSDYLRNIRDCCRKVVEDSEVGFCPKCGTNLTKLRGSEVDPEYMIGYCDEFISNLVAADNDSMDSDLWELMQANGWNMPGYMNRSGIVTFIDSKAEWLLGDFDGARKSWLWNERTNWWDNVSFGRYTDLKIPE